LRSAPILAVLFLTSSACALTIEEALRFETERKLHISVSVKDLQTPNLSLSWPIPSSHILELPPLANQSGVLTKTSESALTVFVTCTEPVSFSFLVEFPCEDSRNHAFPAARSGANISRHTLRVLLPDGWTAAGFSQGCRKIYDPEAGRVALEWADVGSGRCEAVLLRPGREAEIRWRLTWMMIRGYVLVGLLVVLVLLGAILLRRIAL